MTQLHADSASNSSGFTLLEALVGLAISAMIAALLTSVLRQALTEGAKTAAVTNRSITRTLDVLRVRELLRSNLPSYSSQPPSVTGTDTEFTVFSAKSSGGKRLPPASMKLSIDVNQTTDRISLSVEGGQGTEVLVQVDGQEGTFSYLDDALEWQDRWPPQPPLEGDQVVPPSAIRMRLSNGDVRQDFVFDVGGRGTPPLRLQDVLSVGQP